MLGKLGIFFIAIGWQKSHGILSGKTENILSSNQIKVKHDITNGHLFNRCSFVIR